MNPSQGMERHKGVPDIFDATPARFLFAPQPSLSTATDILPGSKLASLVEEDNIKALESIRMLLELNPDFADSADFIAIGKLMEKLERLRSRPATIQLLGGMTPIDEGKIEVENELKFGGKISKKPTRFSHLS